MNRKVHERILRQFATRKIRVDLGPSLEGSDGYYAANRRTIARAEGIKTFLASHSWADTLDLRTFLDGFDAGEEYRMAFLRELDNQAQLNVREKIPPMAHPS
jgi:hypothetical protein